MSEEYYQELNRLKDLACVPAVRQMLEDMIKNQPQFKRPENAIREPIKRSRAKLQTIFITKGYAWSQTSSSVSLYIPLENAKQIPENCCSLTVLERSVELNATFPQKGVVYNFKIGQLYDSVKPDNAFIKYKTDKVVVTLAKTQHGLEWADLRSKSTQTTYNELERFEKQYQPIAHEHIESLFGTPAPIACTHQNDEKHGDCSHTEPKDTNTDVDS